MNLANPGRPASSMPSTTTSTAHFPAMAPPADPAAFGHCRTCGRQHRLGEGGARRHCLELMGLLEERGTVDLFTTSTEPDPRFATAPLFDEARGKMFGVLECRSQDGEQVVLRAFSGQCNGIWEVPGWAPPLFDVREFDSLNCEVEKEIKRLGREMDHPLCGAENGRELRRQRRRLSQGLMREIHGLYRLRNFRGEETTLAAAFEKKNGRGNGGENGIPTGSGDCCAPKLLHLAARQNLIPLGIAEFYWGRENRSESRRHGCFYPSCHEKCAPILGFLLCGLEELHAQYCR